RSRRWVVPFAVGHCGPALSQEAWFRSSVPRLKAPRALQRSKRRSKSPRPRQQMFSMSDTRGTIPRALFAAAVPWAAAANRARPKPHPVGLLTADAQSGDQCAVARDVARAQIVEQA